MSPIAYFDKQRRTNGQTKRWTDRQIDSSKKKRQMEVQTHRETDLQMKREEHREMRRQSDRETHSKLSTESLRWTDEGQTDRQLNRQIGS